MSCEFRADKERQLVKYVARASELSRILADDNYDVEYTQEVQKEYDKLNRAIDRLYMELSSSQ